MATQHQAAGRAVVVGGGIVGVCCALYLQREGFAVTLVERDRPGEACSFGNAGMRPHDAGIPIAAPGILRRVPGYLADPDGPLTVSWSYLPRLLPWLLRFLRASSPARYQELALALTALVHRGPQAYAPLIESAGAGDLLRHSGTIQLFESESAFKAAHGDARFRRRLGGRCEILGPEEIRQFVPALAPVFAGALHRPDVDHVIDPLALTQRLVDDFTRKGGTVLQAEVARLLCEAGSTRAVLADGQVLDSDRLVLAAGAWSRRLLRGSGISVPLDTERGYHVMLPRARPDLRLPISSGEGAFYATAMQAGLRIAGTVELAGLDRPPDYRRAEVMLRRVKRWFPDLDTGDASYWMGFRPSLPDSLPVISAVPQRKGLLLAFGHGHLGLTLAGVTGQIIADLAVGRASAVDIAPYRADRF